MSSGLTPLSDLRDEAIDDLEDGVSPSGISKIRKIKLSLRKPKELNKHLTFEQVENLRLRKDKRLLIMQIKKLQQVFSDLGMEIELIERGNQELREISFKELTKIVNSARNAIEEKRKKAEELTEFANNQLKLAEETNEKLEEKAEILNLTEKRQVKEKAIIGRNKKLVKKAWAGVKKAKRQALHWKNLQKLKLERSEINFKASEERVEQVDAIYADIEKEKSDILLAKKEIKGAQKNVELREKQMEIREVAVKDREQAVRRLIDEAKRAGISI